MTTKSIETMPTSSLRRPPDFPARLPASFVDCLVSLSDAVCTQDIHCVIRFVGRLEAERLGRALVVCLEKEPILSCRFVERWYRPYWEPVADLDSVAIYRIKESSDHDPEVIQYLKTARNPAGNLPVDLLLLRGDNDTLCIKFNHMIGDASAMLQFVRLLAACYRDLDSAEIETTTPNLGDRSMKQVSDRFSFREKVRILMRAAARMRHNFMTAGHYSFPASADADEKRSVILRRYGPERVERILAYARGHRVTPTLVFEAAFGRALGAIATEHPESAITLPLTVDLRRYLTTDQEIPICNLSGVTRLRLERPWEKSLDELVADLTPQVQQRHNPYLGLEFLPVLRSFPPLNWLSTLVPYGTLKRRFARLTAKRSSRKLVSALVDVGDVGRQVSFGDTQVDDFYCVHGTHLALGFSVVVARFRGALTLSVAFAGSLMDESTMTALLDQLDAELPP